MEVIEPRRLMSSVTSSASVLKRTGTSNSNPAVIVRPDPRGGAESDKAGRGIDGPAGGLLDPAERDAQGSGHWFGDGARPGLRARGVALDQLEGGRRAVAGADGVFEGRQDLWSPQSLKRKPCSRPIRDSKKVTTAARSSARRMP